MILSYKIKFSRWYYWKLKPKDVTHFTRLFPWLCYICHQLTVWSVLYLGQVAKTKDAILTGRTKYTGKMYRYGWMLFGINAVFSLVHLVQTHLTYDGLAQDASYASIDSSMLLLVILIMLVEYSERGWVFGWPSLYHTSTCSNILRLRLAPIYLLRKYHGYAISWVAVYILWYHPMENTYGHAIGICFAWLILIQGSLMYSKMHLNAWWRFFLQLSVAVYATISAAQATSVETVLRGTRTWPTYIFGYTFVAALTWIFILKVWRKMPNWTRIFPIVIVVGVTAGNYTWITWEDGQPFMRLYEILQIPGLYYIYSLFLWVLLQMMFMLYKSQRKRAYQMEDSLSACTKFLYMVAFVLVYAILVAAPVLIHHLNWRTERMTHLIVLLTINVIGVAIATLILLHLNPSVDVPRSSAARLDSMTYIGTLDRRRAKLARQLNNMNGNGSTYVGELSTVNTITTANTINTAMTMSDSSGHTNPAFAMDYSTLPRPGTVEADQDNMIRLLNMYSTI